MSDIETIPIKGRDVPIKKLNETQMMLLVREAQIVRRTSQDSDRRLRGIARMIDIVESALLEPEDQEWLMDLAGRGRIDFAEILAIVAPFEEQAEAPVKTVRRGRAAISRK